MASGCGLVPDISRGQAQLQIPRVTKALPALMASS